MNIDEFLALIDNETQKKVLPIIEYITTKYKMSVFDKDYSKKTMIPTWKYNGNYVGIGCRKHYISVYFSNHQSVNIVLANTIYCRPHKSCVNFSYKRELPYDAIFQGIDYCFSNL